MSNITRTIYASALQSAQLLGIPYAIPENTTLNEKFNILPEELLADGQYPLGKFLAIGRGGHKHVTGADGSALTDLHVHRPSDAALFNHMPFVLRPLDNDLIASERDKYAMRRLETYDGITYIAYYLRRLNNSDLVTNLSRVAVQDGNTNTLPYVPSSADLSPTPVEIDPTEVTATSGEYLTASTMLTVEFSAYEISEIVNAMVIKYGDPLYATISEFGLVSGVDFLSEAQNGDNPPFNYLEAIGAQINTHICTHHPVHQLNNGLVVEYELGGSESLTIPNTQNQLIG